MSDYRELREAVRHYAAHGRPLLPLRECAERYDQPISDSPDAPFRDLISDVWAVLSECDAGELTRDEAAARLRTISQTHHHTCK
jgi:hypothetical protein